MTSSYELSAAADDDLQSIVAYTSERYGARQALDYIDGLATCAENLASGYGYYKTLKDIHPALRVKHCQHHYIFGLMREGAPMLVIAILHERMELMTRLKGRLP